MRYWGITLFLMGCFFIIIFGLNIYQEIQSTAIVKHNYKPPFAAHEIINMGFVFLGTIMFFVGVAIENKAVQRDKFQHSLNKAAKRDKTTIA